jgi:hypothetical protein
MYYIITTNVVISNPSNGEGVLDATLYDKVSQWLATGRWLNTIALTLIEIHLIT